MKTMKNSGIPWIKEIPLDWETCRVSDVFFRKNRKAYQLEPTILTLARSGIKIRDISSNEGQIAESYYEYNSVTKNDLLLNPMDLQSGDNCSISKVEGVISPAYINLRHQNNISPDFYNYLFKVYYWTKALFTYGKGVSFDNRWTLNYETLSHLKIVKPKYEEQLKIANYLDEKCGEIDGLISEIEKEIEVLTQYKKSIITETVTRGLKKDIKLKKSKISWIVQIPEHWEISKIKYNLSRKTVRNPGNAMVLSLYREYGIVPKDSRDDNHNVTSEDTSKYLFVKKGQFVINKMKAWQGSMAISKYEGIVSPAYYVYDVNPNNLCKEYLHYLLKNPSYIEEFRRLSGGVREGQWDLPAEEFENLLILIPPIQEQKEIAEYLDKKCKEIDSILEDKNKQLETLESYKKSIIYEYVTGKKEVK